MSVKLSIVIWFLSFFISSFFCVCVIIIFTSSTAFEWSHKNMRKMHGCLFYMSPFCGARRKHGRWSHLFLRPSPFCVTQGFPSRTQKDIDMDLSIDAQWKTSFSRNPRLSHDTIFTFGDVEHVGHVKVGHTKTKRKKHVTKDGDNVHEAKKRRYIKILKENSNYLAIDC